jgi:hypothetical protein
VKSVESSDSAATIHDNLGRIFTQLHEKLATCRPYFTLMLAIESLWRVGGQPCVLRIEPAQMGEDAGRSVAANVSAPA